VAAGAPRSSPIALQNSRAPAQRQTRTRISLMPGQRWRARSCRQVCVTFRALPRQSINQVKKRAVLRRGSGVARAESAEEAASPPHVASRGAPVRSERVGAFHWSNEVEDGSADAQRGAVPGEKAVQRAAGESSAGESSAGIPSLQKLVSSKQLAEDTAPQTAMA
jgi:hypothetical protein